MKHPSRPQEGGYSTRQRAAFALLSGALLGLSFPPFPLAPIAWVALVPLLLTWFRQTTARAAYLAACFTFLTTFAIACHWPLVHVRADTALLSLPGLIALPLWMAIPFGLSVHVRRRIGVPAGLLVLAALFVLAEWGLRRGPLAFPWALLGHTQAELGVVNGLAAYGGVPLLTVFVLAVNMSVASALTHRRLPGIAAGMIASVCLLAALIPMWETASDTRLRVALVQPAVPAEDWADLSDVGRVEILLALSDTVSTAAAAGGDSVDLVIWPETALPPSDAVSWRRAASWAAARGASLLSGAIEETGDGDYYNAAMLFRPDGTREIYRKRRLVPFAEAVPFQERFAWIRRLAIPSGGVAGYVRGVSSHPMEVRRARFGVLICFETLFDDLARGYALEDAGVLIAITQDGWWGDTFGYRQHLAFNRLRAIELGRPLIQVSVSGLSAVIAPDGSIGGRIGWMERSAAVATVYPAHTVTPYVRMGDWVSPLALVVVVLATFFAIYVGRS